ncbi:mitogen-activated protein kinase-binding protein 1-like [Polymixia lowei]
MTGDGSTIKSRIRNLLRSPSIRKKKHSKESIASKVTLEKVLGITASGNSGLACDPRSGLVAYPAGCVVVLLNPKKNRQYHIINTSRKTITALSFSPDGKYLVTGESGHLPAVRLWDVAERRQVAELQKHKYGISCVAFSPNSKYIVSVGNQHDMMVNVWAWKKDVIVAANKVSSKVTAVSFSEDSSYFVTAGNRHVKFWYLDHCKPIKASTPVPLLGRSGLLGELRNNFFCDVACGRGSKSDSTFCITSSGLLCEFNSKRMLDKWVDIRTGVAQSLSLSEHLIFCGGADGTVRAFSPADLHFVCTLPRPHPLGTDVSAITQASHLFSTKMATRYPDSIAVNYDPVGHWLSCVYNDHSLYVWDVRDVHRVGKVHSALFHAASVWDLQMFPEVPGGSHSGLSSGGFLSCSSDNTIRLWCMERQGRAQVHTHNVLSNDLLNVIYMDGNTAAPLDSESTACVNAEKAWDGQTAESRTGIRSICVSPDGKHLASGDRNGMLRVHDLSSLEEILKVEAHDAEILCLEYSKPETGLKLLATASRDRLIHVLDAENDYGLVQTLDEHSSSITAVRFAANDNKVRMISCGADKSIYFRTAYRTDRGTQFRRSHHVARKTTLYDMGVDPTCKYAAVGCQDRCIRIFNISNGKQRKLYKGSLSEDGSLLRVQTDPSGQYVATSCSDKNISIFDFHTGECVATMFGHSEIVTGMKFTNDCKHLISVSGDSCIFIWRLAPELTINMRERLCQLKRPPSTPPCKTATLRREVCSAPSLGGLSSDSDRDHEEDGAERDDPNDPEDTLTNTSCDSSNGEEDTGGSDEGQDWESTKVGVVSNPGTPDTIKRPRRRWSHRMGSLEVMVKSMLDLRQLETFSHKKSPLSRAHDRDTGSTSSLQEPMQLEERIKKRRPWPHNDWLSLHTPKAPKGSDGAVLYPEGNEDNISLHGSGYMVKEQHRGETQDSHSPDSACSLDYDSREPSPDHALEDSEVTETLSQVSSDEEHEGQEEDAEDDGKTDVRSVDEALQMVTDVLERSQEDFLKQNFETLADNSNMAKQSGSLRLSMSSRFLARGHNNRRVPLFVKAGEKEPAGHAAKPPVFKVRPLMEGDQSGSTEDTTPVIEGPDGLDADVPERDPLLRSGTLRKRAPGTHLWRLSSPSFRASLLADKAADLQKSQSVQNLSADSPRSPVPSGDRAEVRQRPQQLLVDRDSPKPLSHIPSPSSGSPQSLPSPLPWESPKLKPQRTYMSPTTSSMAKYSHPSSPGEGVPTETPPSSPSLLKRRRSSGLLDSELPLLTSSPVSARPAPLSFSSSPSWPVLPGSPGPSLAPLSAAVSPRPGRSFALHSSPSRIPLLKQPLGPRRSLCPEAKSSWDCPKESGPEALGDERPPVATADPQPESFLSLDHSVTLETCRQTAAELHNSLRKTTLLYATVLSCGPDPSGDRQEMRTVLSAALGAVRAELDSLLNPTLQPGGAQGELGAKGEGERALALLEQYSELLLKSVEKRLDGKT